MQKLFTILCMATIALFFASCSDNDDVVVDELQDLKLVTTISNATHKIELYTATGDFRTGYNAVYFQIKDADGALVQNATASWTPVMSMTSMSHSCPASEIAKKQDAESTYAGYIVFQMASNDTEYWELTLDYTINGTAYTAKDKIQVTQAPKRVVESFTGADNERYIVALVEPVAPKVAVNDIKAVIYQMESMMSFVPVEGYKLKIDPRMPGMGNHTSPNNVDLEQGDDEMYQGKLSLTMTGYWKINLQLVNTTGEILKGEAVTETVEGSSIYFELEF